MHINYMNQSNEDSWRNYQKYLEPILDKTLKKVGHNSNVEVSVVMVNDDTIHEYNKNYRNIDRPTDVLSFVDGEEIDGVLSLGDIIISVDKVRSQAEDYGHSLKREYCFLVAHGFLHLLGYDHETKEEEEEMTRLQKEILDEIAKRPNR